MPACGGPERDQRAAAPVQLYRSAGGSRQINTQGNGLIGTLLKVGGEVSKGGRVTSVDFGTIGRAAQSSHGLWSLPAPSFITFPGGAIRIQIEQAGEDVIPDIVGPSVTVWLLPPAPFLIVDLVVE